MHKKNLGSLGEATVMQQVLKHGCAAFIEYGDNSKIDLIVCDQDNELHRVQVKVINRTASPTTTKLLLYKSGPNGYRVKYKSTEIDWFAVVDITKQEIAWIPSSVCNTHGSAIALRHTPKLNGGGRYEGNYWEDYLRFPFGPDKTLSYVVNQSTALESKYNQQARERNALLVKKVLDSNIDFSKLGWVKQVATLLGKREQKINAWMKKYMLEFYEKNCYKRNSAVK